MPPSPRSRLTRRASPSWACAPASSPRSACRTGCSPGAPTSTRTTAPAASRRSWSRSSAPAPAPTASAPRWGPGPRSAPGHDLVLTEVDDGFVVASGSPAGDRLLARLPGPRATAAQIAAASGAVAATRAGDGRRRGRRRGPARSAHGQARQPALGRGRRPLPGLRQLHDGLPDLLLHLDRRALRPRRHGQRGGARVGLLLQHRLRQGRRRQLPTEPVGPIPPVAHPQVRDLARPVRHAPAASAAADASPGARSGSTSARSWPPLRRRRSPWDASRRARRPPPRAASTWRPCARSMPRPTTPRRCA